MSEKPLFDDADEEEATYAPQQLPGEERVQVDDGPGGVAPISAEPPAAAPVANLGNAPSAAAAPPNIGHADHGGAPGDPESQAQYPIGDDKRVKDE